jgi:hypothetical protein
MPQVNLFSLPIVMIILVIKQLVTKLILVIKLIFVIIIIIMAT